MSTRRQVKRREPPVEDYRRMSPAQLSKFIQKVVNQKATAQELERQKLRDRLEAEANKHGYTLKQLVQRRYRNPENPSQSWGGKGPKPKWLKELISHGVKPSEVRDPERFE